MDKIRVLLVEDSVTVRKRLVEVLAADPEIQVAGEAGDGKTAIELCERLRPDVVTVDMQLPVLSGLAVTEYIMAYCPTRILIVSASVNRGELFKTYDALAAGALEVLDKPKGDCEEGEWERTFLSTIKLIARIPVITHVRARLRHGALPAIRPAEPASYRLVTVGASTGGPSALLEMLRALPADFPLPIVAVVHIAETFGSALAEWLDNQSPLRVHCAAPSEPLPRVGDGQVILAPPGRHAVLSEGRILLTDRAERFGCRPSVDVLFQSAAREFGPQSIACLLTGMGRDGAEGLLAIRQAGGRTLAQDEATSVIFGMPAAAIRIGAAEKILGLYEIAAELRALAGSPAAGPKICGAPGPIRERPPRSCKGAEAYRSPADEEYR